MPHKASIMSEVNALTKEAHVIGAINTIVMLLDER
jgi:shikimate 5-dehydrogenase